MKNDKEYLRRRIDFSKNLYKEVLPVIAPFEKDRKKYLLYLSIMTILVSFIIYLVYIFFFKSIFRFEIFYFGLIYLVPIIFLCIFQDTFHSDISGIVMKNLCSCFGDIHWQKSNIINNDSTYVLAQVIPSHDKDEHDDAFLGAYKGVNVVIDEAHYYIKVRTKNGTSYSTVFDGIVITFEFNKEFKSHTVIKNNSLLHISPSMKLKHTVLEDVEFEKKFDVYTNDELEARYLITPSFMDRLNNLKMSFRCSKIVCSFYKNSLYISLDTRKNMFDIASLFKSVLNEKQYFQLFDEFYSILNIVDVLKLNQKIGM